MAAGTVGRTGSARPTRPEELEAEVVLLAGQARLTEAGARHAEHAQPLVGHRRDLRRQVRRRRGVEVAEVGDRLGRALGGDDVVVPVRRLPDVRHRQQLARQRVLAHERPVLVQVLGVGEVAAARAAWNAFSIGSKGSLWLARMPNSTTSWKASGSGARVLAHVVLEPPCANSLATDIRFSVSVPVLSTQSTVAEPSVSTAGMRRVRTRSAR